MSPWLPLAAGLAGVLCVVAGGLILGSDLQRTWFPDAGPDFPGALDPDRLAIELTELIGLGNGPERMVPAPTTEGN